MKLTDEIIQLRKTLITLLDDENGINHVAYDNLKTMSMSIGKEFTANIFNAVDSSEGRYYLPEDHGLTAETIDESENRSHQFVNCGGYPRCAVCGCDEDDAFVGGEDCTKFTSNL